MADWTDEEFEQWLDETFPPGKLYRQPEYWDDTRFNNPAQPVVGVTWFEARAYCNWLTANSHGVPPSGGTESIFRLPTEAEFEAAARGKKGQMFPYGKEFEMSRSNTFESHIRRSTPVGIFQQRNARRSLRSFRQCLYMDTLDIRSGKVSISIPSR
ncbi:MAG: SUMF1/EgtB/PvdO family nonheme iron enzyme [Acidobacteria bacterium]|nr:SUMF1/EgtB/PvdO family nonheme iron enzyme [Acidobacteriota bacterium]